LLNMPFNINQFLVAFPLPWGGEFVISGGKGAVNLYSQEEEKKKSPGVSPGGGVGNSWNWSMHYYNMFMQI